MRAGSHHVYLVGKDKSGAETYYETLIFNHTRLMARWGRSPDGQAAKQGVGNATETEYSDQAAAVKAAEAHVADKKAAGYVEAKAPPAPAGITKIREAVSAATATLACCSDGTTYCKVELVGPSVKVATGKCEEGHGRGVVHPHLFLTSQAAELFANKTLEEHLAKGLKTCTPDQCHCGRRAAEPMPATA